LVPAATLEKNFLTRPSPGGGAKGSGEEESVASGSDEAGADGSAGRSTGWKACSDATGSTAVGSFNGAAGDSDPVSQAPSLRNENLLFPNILFIQFHRYDAGNLMAAIHRTGSDMDISYIHSFS